MTFYEWLIQQQGREDSVGDLGTDAARDKRFPREQRPLAGYIDFGERFGEHITEALVEAWDEWSRATVVLGQAACYVYFIQGTESRRVKIGVSADPRKRLKELQTGNSEPLRLLLAVPGTADDEAALHAANAATRAVGEWFGWTDQLSEQLASSCRAMRPMPVMLGESGPLEMRARAMALESVSWLFSKAAQSMLTEGTMAYPLTKLALVAGNINELHSGRDWAFEAEELAAHGEATKGSTLQ